MTRASLFFIYDDSLWGARWSFNFITT